MTPPCGFSVTGSYELICAAPLSRLCADPAAMLLTLAVLDDR
jgi:hypothetical protein